MARIYKFLQTYTATIISIQQQMCSMNQIGARNIKGFSASVSLGVLPQPTHLTYEGIFNQLKFEVGKKTQELVDLHLGYARYQFERSRYDKEINDYLALFLKSKKDGADRDDRPLNAIICLDISGSMSGGLGDSNSKNNQSRLSLSIEAIKMFISKLRPKDSIGLVTFNNSAHVIFEPIYKKQIGESIYKDLDEIKAGGGTTIKAGFQTARKLLEHFINKHSLTKCENRMIMLTDVCDNTLSNEKQFIDEASHSNIHLTIVGISNQFKSEVCECLKNIKGFNYFCAINQDDIKKYVFQTFDFGFFSAAYDLDIEISSQDLISFEVFGATDSAQVSEYNDHFKGNPTSFTITRMPTVFPSELEIQKDTVYTYGGLILLKLKRKSKIPFFKGEISLKYKSLDGENKNKIFEISYEFHPEEQFFSDNSLRAALEGFTFASEMRNILSQSKKINKKLLKQTFSETLKCLKEIAPESKLKDLQNVTKIIENQPMQEQEEEQEYPMMC